MHADVRESGLGSKGASKSVSAASKDIMLSKWQLHHAQRFGFRSMQDCWKRHLGCGNRARAWRVKKMIAKLETRTRPSRVDGYVLFRRDRIR
eukprot:12819358-Alexandrium_andersonii.AAC.1